MVIRRLILLSKKNSNHYEFKFLHIHVILWLAWQPHLNFALCTVFVGLVLIYVVALLYNT